MMGGYSNARDVLLYDTQLSDNNVFCVIMQMMNRKSYNGTIKIYINNINNWCVISKKKV